MYNLYIIVNKLIYDIYIYIFFCFSSSSLPLLRAPLHFTFTFMTKMENYILHLAFIPHISAGPDVIFNLDLY